MLHYGGSSGRAPLIMYSQATVRSRTKDQAVLRRDLTWKRGSVDRFQHQHTPTYKWITATAPGPPEVSGNILNQSEWYNWYRMDTNQAFTTHEFLATRARQKGPPTPALSLPLRPCRPVSKCWPYLFNELGATGSSEKSFARCILLGQRRTCVLCRVCKHRGIAPHSPTTIALSIP